MDTASLPPWLAHTHLPRSVRGMSTGAGSPLRSGHRGSDEQVALEAILGARVDPVRSSDLKPAIRARAERALVAL